MYKSFDKGRSMIEMLGVLAIIGVLSVGGIAGYSKAMEQFKVNKAINQYNMLIFGMLEHLDGIKKENKGEFVGLLGLAKDLNLIPASWQADERSEYMSGFGNKLTDDLGNTIQLFFVPNGHAGASANQTLLSKITNSVHGRSPQTLHEFITLGKLYTATSHFSPLFIYSSGALFPHKRYTQLSQQFAPLQNSTDHIDGLSTGNLNKFLQFSTALTPAGISN